MGTKTNPGSYDCYANAAPDEPMFILLGRDPMAPSLVESWAYARELEGGIPEKIENARQCAASMRDWLKKLDKDEEPITVIGCHLWRVYFRVNDINSWKIFVSTVERRIDQVLLAIEPYLTARSEEYSEDIQPDIEAIEHLGTIAA